MRQPSTLNLGGHLAQRVFVSGRAPKHWQQQLSHQVIRGDILEPHYRWIEAIATLSLKLKEQPLLGYTLMALTALVVDPVATEATEPEAAISSMRRWPTSPDRHRSRQQASSLERSDLSRSPPASPHLGERQPPQPQSQPIRSTSSQKVLEFPGQARQTLLQRWLPTKTNPLAIRSETQLSVSSRKQLAQMRVQSSMVRRSPLPEQTQFKEVTLPSHPVAISSGLQPTQSLPEQALIAATPSSSQPLWTKALGARIQRVLATYQRDGNYRQTLPEAVVSEWRSPLSPWAISLQGPTASTALLNNLIHPIQAQAPPASLSPGATVSSINSGAPLEPRVSQRPPTPPATPFWDLPRETPHDSNLEVYAGRDTEQFPQVAPPSMTRSLPPLIPPSSTLAPIPPITATLVHDGIHREAIATTEEDLNLLASKIKRILDEEARRYGIDV